MQTFSLVLQLIDRTVAHPAYPAYPVSLIVEGQDTPDALTAMVAAGWIHPSASPFSRHDWPRRPHQGDSPAAWELWEQRCDELLRHHGDAAETIPSYKLGTNEGWIITPDEIRAALKSYVTGPSDPLSAILWHLQLGAAGDGVRVRLQDAS